MYIYIKLSNLINLLCCLFSRALYNFNIMLLEIWKLYLKKLDIINVYCCCEIFRAQMRHRVFSSILSTKNIFKNSMFRSLKNKKKLIKKKHPIYWLVLELYLQFLGFICITYPISFLNRFWNTSECVIFFVIEM